jgi:general secretion pathway protein A
MPRPAAGALRPEKRHSRIIAAVQPPASPHAYGEPPYETFYGLREQPFSLTTDPRFLFLSASHRRAYDELLSGLRRREGLLLLTGDTGTGKTTLCRAVIDALGPRTFSALILNPYMSGAEVLRVIMRDFGLVSRDEIRNGVFDKADTPQLLDTLERFLQSLRPLESFAVVVIDEAQSLSPAVLDQIRVLGGIEQHGQRLLQIVLSGQPALGTTVLSEPMRALNDRITRRAALAPLAPAEIGEYIRHRLAIAGAGDRMMFTPEAVQLVATLSLGLPRRINALCDRTLETGQLQGSSELGPLLVKQAAASIAGAAGPAADDAPPPDEPGADRVWDLDKDLVRTERKVVEIPISLGADLEPRSAGGRARWLWVGIVIAAAAAALAAGAYAWSWTSVPLVIPELPDRPKLALPPRLQARPVPAEGLQS